MPTFKTVIHPPYKRADGTFRVKIRITHNKQSRYLPTPYYASAAEVNDKFDFKRGTSYVDDTRPIERSATNTPIRSTRWMSGKSSN